LSLRLIQRGLGQQLSGEKVYIQEILASLRLRLADLTETPNLDSQVLLADVLQKSRAWLLAHPEAELSPLHIEKLEQAVSRLESGDPLAYILGRKEFFGLEFLVNSSTLIPRPETELLVEHALLWLKANPYRRTAADAGTGSGCIAVSLAVNCTGLQVLAGDLSWEALQVARQNTLRHGVSSQVRLVQADLLPAAAQKIDLICANLPYIPTRTLHQLDVYGKEPDLALDGGPDGLDVIRRLVELSRRILAPGGLLLLEIEASQGDAAVKLAAENFPTAKIRLQADLAGNDRLLIIEEQR
jgi:release factor glutamine methyltransferase